MEETMIILEQLFGELAVNLLANYNKILVTVDEDTEEDEDTEQGYNYLMEQCDGYTMEDCSTTYYFGDFVVIVECEDF